MGYNTEYTGTIRAEPSLPLGTIPADLRKAIAAKLGVDIITCLKQNDEGDIVPTNFEKIHEPDMVKAINALVTKFGQSHLFNGCFFWRNEYDSGACVIKDNIVSTGQPTKALLAEKRKKDMVAKVLVARSVAFKRATKPTNKWIR